MKILLIVLYLFLVFQRLGELVIARSNRRWMLERGAREVGENHYFLFIVLHSLFFVSIGMEFYFTSFQWNPLFYPALTAFFILQVLRIWCIATLGRRWNTRILVLPDEEPISKGLYRIIKHPNYVIVFFELLVIPVLFHAYYTALIFPFLHLMVLTVRIPAEEKALQERV
ncbi:isoprenylcysteine carboxyl methyltransferase family protein [Halobacillus mangrovi]|uniref:isoprenylcysteine carboxyl methyltransferase family protein n=1 Tax=Halobacillus mangrovi TaxID=402384 RepID=UPI003D99C46F